ncbi:alpha/beta hydrolase [Actinomadura logoneensis]|uniref:Alpha/beta hydrolase n=1 Tax=Actinomadura logoneensis TaxID=2293572 RepID=A0A372JHN4_9ACTN|nr:alpha/beta hydrolase [Actinomadura logoneensis]RFU39535.1 alpha/beta hydrolase [Actinomadura logoneensis]
MKTMRLNGHDIDFDVTGEAPEHPTLLLLSGWCQDHRLFDRVLPVLAAERRVVRMDWRGHGAQRTVAGDFGPDEMADDAVALLRELGETSVVPVSTSHGGWANLEMADRLGAAAAPRVVVVDWLVRRPAPEFLRDLRAGYHPDTWRQGRQALFDTWLDQADSPEVVHHLNEEMAGFDAEMWTRSCRVIEAAYQRWGSPLERMLALAEPRPVAHLYSQPSTPEHHREQREFSAGNPWFQPRWLGGPTHFPTLDSPEVISEAILAFAAGARR